MSARSMRRGIHSSLNSMLEAAAKRDEKPSPTRIFNRREGKKVLFTIRSKGENQKKGSPPPAAISIKEATSERKGDFRKTCRKRRLK